MGSLEEMGNIVISIKPEFCKAIYSGKKLVELRKGIGSAFVPGARLYIYTSSPEKAITGEAIIESVQRLTPSDIKDQYLASACISEKDFDQYYLGKEYGHVISLSSIMKYEFATGLSEMRRLGFHAPQSYSYPTQEIINYIESRKCI
ncbi:hypothetical protein GVN15_25750 [Pseudomonas putida]|uniref:hypothetical protein n=1 Tax=Pseudomonas putida TaxID=303 RepID=UPI00137839DA|nr:hypothetical protein [Pseudomonas putida]NBA84046.1 hypothetical protein [Pseudomonas putida]